MVQQVVQQVGANPAERQLLAETHKEHRENAGSAIFPEVLLSAEYPRQESTCRVRLRRSRTRARNSQQSFPFGESVAYFPRSTSYSATVTPNI